MTNPTSNDTRHPFIDDLSRRGMLYQKTDGIEAALHASTISAYVGFDPTAASLHVGNLLAVMGLVHLQRHGHTPIVLVGGGTGLIGDPSGRTSERPLLSRDQIAANAAAFTRQLSRYLDFGGRNAARMVDNAEWLVDLRAIDFMRDVGKHFTVNYMMQKDSVKSRLDAGISYTEFSYMLLQAYDYLEVHRRYGVTLQMGGSDQWGNITAGTELIRRTTGTSAHAVTFPLITNNAGAKFGKSEGGAIWLDPTMTSPYKFYQFWMRCDDRDASRYLRLFTLMPDADVQHLDEETSRHPERREAQRALALTVTETVHGHAAATAAAEVSVHLFGGGNPAALSIAAIEMLRSEIPYVEVPDVTLVDARAILDAVTGGAASLFSSRGDAKRLLQQGGVYANGQRLSPESGDVVPIHGQYVLIRKGKNDALIRFPNLSP